MKNIIQFIISQGMDGYYIASATALPIVTQGKTLDELTKNIAEATELYLEVTHDDPLRLDNIHHQPCNNSVQC